MITKLGATVEKLGVAVESQFKETNSKIDAKIDKLDKDLNSKIDAKIDKLDSKIDKLDKDLSDQMVKEIKRQSTPLALKIGSIASIVAGLLSYFQFEIIHPTIRPPSFTIEKNTRA